MLDTLIRKVFGDPSEKKLKQYQKELRSIKEIEIELSLLNSLEEVQSRVREIRTRFE